MAFNTTSFFAGVGTVFAAITIGFAGGAMITTSPKLEPNRLERVTTSAAVITPNTSATSSVPAAKTETAETAAAPDRVISLTQAPDSPQTLPPQPQPVTANNNIGSQNDVSKNARDAELKKETDLKKAERRAEQRRERRKQIQAATNAVRQMRLNGDLQVVSQGDGSPRFGFFGND